MKDRIFSVLKPAAAAAIGLTVGLLFTAFAGEKPWEVLLVLARSAFGSRYDFGLGLFYATPLIFTGLSVAVAWQAGLFNIGAEGQLNIGACAAAAFALSFPHLPPGLAVPGAIGAAMFAGAAWSGIAAWLRVRRGAHEVITTILLNFLAAALTSYLAIRVFKDPDSPNAETSAIAAAYRVASFKFFDGAPLGWALPLAIVTAVALEVLLYRTALGFEIRAVGSSESAARASGLKPGRLRLIAMALAGALAGLVAVPEVLGASGRFKFDFSPGYGFTGIAVAILARGNPIGVVLGALFFGFLEKGALDLDFETENVTRELALVLQGFVILFVAAEGLWHIRLRKKKVKA